MSEDEVVEEELPDEEAGQEEFEEQTGDEETGLETPPEAGGRAGKEGTPQYAQDAIDKATREKHDALRRAAVSDARYEESQKHVKPDEAPPEAKRPNRDDYPDEDVQGYEDDLLEWNRQETLKAVKTTIADDREAERVKEENDAVARTFKERHDKGLSEGQAKYADFDTVAMNPNLAISDAMVEFINESDMRHDIAYYLGKNPAKAAELFNNPNKKAVERGIWAIEEGLKTTPNATTELPPPPIRPVSNSRGAVDTDVSKLSDDDYYKYEKKREMDKIKKRVEGG